MTLHVSVVVGNPRAGSRTLKVAEALAITVLRGADYSLALIDLADYADEVLVWPSETMDTLNKNVAASDLVVFASPTYKATYTGLLKAFLDRYPANGLNGVTAIPLLTGADTGHAMAPTFNLAPLLVELGATVPGRGLYFVIGQMDRLDEVMQEAAASYAAAFGRLAHIAAALPTVNTHGEGRPPAT